MTEIRQSQEEATMDAMARLLKDLAWEAGVRERDSYQRAGDCWALEKNRCGTFPPGYSDQEARDIGMELAASIAKGDFDAAVFAESARNIGGIEIGEAAVRHLHGMIVSDWREIEISANRSLKEKHQNDLEFRKRLRGDDQ